ncbi:MAG: NAD(P)-binding protein [Pseudomonadota bacterium]
MATTQQLTADYLVVGAGAMGMAFIDTLLDETDASVIVVDRHDKPGGHWNDSYPYVRLHQPSAFYGVNSQPLGENRVDAQGWNEGLFELASGAEVCTYFDHLMQRKFLPSGRVRYFPNCEFSAPSDPAQQPSFSSRVSDANWSVTVAARVVDATYMNVQVPSVIGPRYEVAEEARIIPPNGLPRAERPADGYVVVGGGKTAMDACLWLLANRVAPDAIRWIMPRDSWLLDRHNIQPGSMFVDRTLAWQAAQQEAMAAADDFDDLFARLDACGALLRFDPEVKPTMYRCATVTRKELDALRSIDNIVRLGRVQRIEADRITLAEGEIPTTRQTLHVDCTGDALARRPVVPIFEPGKLTLQSVRTCQQVFSAAFIAHVEAAYDDDTERNRLCTVVPHPSTDGDFLRTALGNMHNTFVWSADEGLQAWLMNARLDGFSSSDGGAPSAEAGELLARVAASAPQAAENLQRFIAQASSG